MSPIAIAFIIAVVVLFLFVLFNSPSKIEARKNYLIGEIEALELGINQVSIAATRFKGETAEETASVQERCVQIVEQVSAASYACEIMLEDATTEAQLKPIQDTLAQARRQLREARTLLGMLDDEEDDFRTSDED